MSDRFRRAFALALAAGGAACSSPGHVGEALPDAGVVDAAPVDAETDAGPALADLCEKWCGALEAACGAAPGVTDETGCAPACRTRLATLRGTCPQTFRDYFGCLLDGGEWACAGPGVARPAGCTDFAEAWQTCSR